MNDLTQGIIIGAGAMSAYFVVRTGWADHRAEIRQRRAARAYRKLQKYAPGTYLNAPPEATPPQYRAAPTTEQPAVEPPHAPPTPQ